MINQILPLETNNDDGAVVVGGKSLLQLEEILGVEARGDEPVAFGGEQGQPSRCD